MKQRPFCVDSNEYPFQSRWFERRGASMHYIDEGAGIPIVMCHGNPTWSYLYRHIIKALAPRCRCIAFDLPGFGFSDHPIGYGYKPQEHAEWVEAFLFEHLQLERFILVVQDWGGPIGLSIATRHPEKILGVVISSTWAWAPKTIARIFSKVMGSSIGQYLILRHNFFATTLISLLLGKNVSPTTLRAYADPFPTPASRMGQAVFPVQIVGALPWLEEISNRLYTLAATPIEFIFGLRDLGTRPADIALWLSYYPNAGTQRVARANHFTQEDCPENYVEAVHRIINQPLREPIAVTADAPTIVSV